METRAGHVDLLIGLDNKELQLRHRPMHIRC
jgi:hypothetical protein